jgi:hypothetical protein
MHTESALTIHEVGVWWRSAWWAHIWMVSASYVLAIVVPFGLAALLYFVEPTRTQLLLVTLVCSCISLILQVLDNVLRQKDRAEHFRSILTDLEFALAQFESGRIDFEAFDVATTLARDRLKADMGHV